MFHNLSVKVVEFLFINDVCPGTHISISLIFLKNCYAVHIAGQRVCGAHRKKIKEGPRNPIPPSPLPSFPKIEFGAF